MESAIMEIFVNELHVLDDPPLFLQVSLTMLKMCGKIHHQCPQCTASYSRWQPLEFQRGWKDLLWKSIKKYQFTKEVIL